MKFLKKAFWTVAVAYAAIYLDRSRRVKRHRTVHFHRHSHIGFHSDYNHLHAHRHSSNLLDHDSHQREHPYNDL